jgi:hypothetical protein
VTLTDATVPLGECAAHFGFKVSRLFISLRLVIYFILCSIKHSVSKKSGSIVRKFDVQQLRESIKIIFSFPDLRFSDGVDRVLVDEGSGGHLPSLSVLGHQALLQPGKIYQAVQLPFCIE